MNFRNFSTSTTAAALPSPSLDLLVNGSLQYSPQSGWSLTYAMGPPRYEPVRLNAIDLAELRVGLNQAGLEDWEILLDDTEKHIIQSDGSEITVQDAWYSRPGGEIVRTVPAPNRYTAYQSKPNTMMQASGPTPVAALLAFTAEWIFCQNPNQEPQSWPRRSHFERMTIAGISIVVPGMTASIRPTARNPPAIRPIRSVAAGPGPAKPAGSGSYSLGTPGSQPAAPPS